MVTSVLKFVLITACLASISPASNAGTPKSLSKNVVVTLSGKTSSLVVHDPRDINIFGLKFLGGREDFGALKTMLGDDLLFKPDVETTKGLLADWNASTDGYFVKGSSVIDPAPQIAHKVQAELAASYGLKPLDQQPLKLATTPVGRTIPKTDIDAILVPAVNSDIVVDVQTFGWQVYRANAFTDLWFVYISRLTIIDTKSRSLIVDSTCTYFDRNAWSSKPYLLGFLGNQKAPLAAVLGKAGDHCLNQFLSKSLQITPRADQ